MKILGKFDRFNFLMVLLFLVLLLSGCTAKGRLQWLDNKIGEMIFSEDKRDEDEKAKDIASSTGESDFSEVDFKDLAREQKEKIDQWLEDNNLNRYGDALGTMYTGGTPLFNEATGESLDRFDYILKKIPDILEKIRD